MRGTRKLRRCRRLRKQPLSRGDDAGVAPADEREEWRWNRRRLRRSPCSRVREREACAAPADCTVAGARPASANLRRRREASPNGDETGIDCGGVIAPRCAVRGGCRTDADCNNVRCNLAAKIVMLRRTTTAFGTAMEPMSIWGSNGAEALYDRQRSSDSDCDAVRCDVTGPRTSEAPAGRRWSEERDRTRPYRLRRRSADARAKWRHLGEGCAGRWDCVSDACAYNHVCVPVKSCVPHEGGDTCRGGGR